MERQRVFYAEDSTPLLCYLDYPGAPFANDLTDHPEGPHVYIHAYREDEQLGAEIWGVYRLSFLEEPYEDGHFYYLGHEADGSLQMDNVHNTARADLSAATLQEIIAWARAGGDGAASTRGVPQRVRLSALAERLVCA